MSLSKQKQSQGIPQLYDSILFQKQNLNFLFWKCSFVFYKKEKKSYAYERFLISISWQDIVRTLLVYWLQNLDPCIAYANTSGKYGTKSFSDFMILFLETWEIHFYAKHPPFGKCCVICTWKSYIVSYIKNEVWKRFLTRCELDGVYHCQLAAILFASSLSIFFIEVKELYHQENDVLLFVNLKWCWLA